ncbi:hypothetical protein LJC19_01640 [Oxalobacter sp. OttesenSCG-928-P03]|nr:hypothetical protein [Oxalobacter sp. OttesenSCG-928-P03]
MFPGNNFFKKPIKYGFYKETHHYLTKQMTDSTTKTSPEKIHTPIDDHFYKLVGNEPVHCTLMEYAENMQSGANRIVAQNKIGELLVSTIFTGIDYSFGLGEKRLFETVIFGMEDDIHPKWQHATWDEAKKEHNRIVKIIEEEGTDSIKKQIREKTAQ